MPGWLQAILIAAGVVLASWVVLVVLAARLPPGLARDLARFLPDCVTAARRLRRDPRVPRRAKVAVAIAAVWVLSPIDLIPEFLPVIGPLDDIVVVVIVLRYAARSVPREVLLEAWPGDPRLLERLIGRSGG
ncbi:YkvA family protein [Actinophytocola sp. KF-1]